MKKTILTTVAALTLFTATITTTNAQNVKRDAQTGNYSQVQTQEAKHDSTTVNTYTDKNGKTEPIFKGKRGGKYICRVSKPSARNNYKGKFYRKYLKD